MNGHTFLFQPGIWKVKGHYWDAEGRIVPLEGESRVAHAGDAWTIHGIMKLLGQQNEIINDYRVNPCGRDCRLTSWISYNPRLGHLEGTFTVVADTIISVFKSENSQYSGSEMLVMRDPETYHVRGVLNKAGVLVATWSIAMTAE